MSKTTKKPAKKKPAAKPTKGKTGYLDESMAPETDEEIDNAAEAHFTLKSKHSDIATQEGEAKQAVLDLIAKKGLENYRWEAPSGKVFILRPKPGKVGLAYDKVKDNDSAE